MKKSHTTEILRKLLNNETLASNDFFISNANQYFCDIKNHGVELIETWENNKYNRGRHKKRRLEISTENIKKAKSYLNSLLGKKPNLDEISESGN